MAHKESMGIRFFNQRKKWRVVFAVGLIISLFSQIAYSSLSKVNHLPEVSNKFQTLNSTFDSFQEDLNDFEKFCDPFADDDQSENKEKENSEEEKADSEDEDEKDVCNSHHWFTKLSLCDLITSIKIKCACHKRVSVIGEGKPLYLLFHSWKPFMS